MAISSKSLSDNVLNTLVHHVFHFSFSYHKVVSILSISKTIHAKIGISSLMSQYKSQMKGDSEQETVLFFIFFMFQLSCATHHINSILDLVVIYLTYSIKLSYHVRQL